MRVAGSHRIALEQAPFRTCYMAVDFIGGNVHKLLDTVPATCFQKDFSARDIRSLECRLKFLTAIDGVWIGRITTHKPDLMVKLGNIGEGSRVGQCVKNADFPIGVILEHRADVAKVDDPSPTCHEHHARFGIRVAP
jgi:hypothetical protein